MTIAGESAGVEGRRQRSHARELRRQAHDAEQRATGFEIAERTESETAQLLAPLAGIGYHLLADRRWPGSRTAQVDMVVVGRAGVFIVDTKAWREVAVHGDRITTARAVRRGDRRRGAGSVVPDGLAGAPPRRGIVPMD